MHQIQKKLDNFDLICVNHNLTIIIRLMCKIDYVRTHKNQPATCQLTRISFVSIFVQIFLPSPKRKRDGLVLSHLQNEAEEAEKFAPENMLIIIMYSICIVLMLMLGV